MILNHLVIEENSRDVLRSCMRYAQLLLVRSHLSRACPRFKPQHICGRRVRSKIVELFVSKSCFSSMQCLVPSLEKERGQALAYKRQPYNYFTSLIMDFRTQTLKRITLEKLRYMKSPNSSSDYTKP